MHKLMKSYQNNIDINISELYNKIAIPVRGIKCHKWERVENADSFFIF